MELQKLPQELENQTIEFNLQTSLLLAIERTNTPIFDTSNTIKDIISEFPKMKIEDIQKAIRGGSLGKYGKTYKFSTQEVCIWIREYQKEKNKNLCL